MIFSCRLLSTLMVLINVLTIVHSTELHLSIVGQFPAPDPKIQFTHMTLNQTQSLIFIGATNWIIQLDLELNLINNISIGHINENIGSNETTINESIVNDYHCKAIVIDWFHEWLISCGTTYHGRCLIHDLKNISHILYRPQQSVVADTVNGSTVAFIGPGPSPQVNQQPIVFYVGASWTSIYRDELIASRSLHPDNLMELVYSNETLGTRLRMIKELQNNFFMQYLFAFQSRGFSFFLTIRAHPNNKDQFITKLARINQNDILYGSYTEILLHCDREHSYQENFIRAKAAFLLSPTSTVHRHYSQDEYLLILFESDTHLSSALCLYPLWAIHKLHDDVYRCFEKNGVKNIDHFYTYFPSCQWTDMVAEKNLIKNSPMIIFDNQLLTSVIADWVGKNVVVFLGTNQTQLIKFIFQMNQVLSVKPFIATQYDYFDLMSDQKEPKAILSGMHLFGNHIYLMTSDKVYKVNIQTCSKYKTCQQCFASNDPYCGWCLSENKCSVLEDCYKSIYWIGNGNDCVSIDSVEPSSMGIGIRKTISIKMKKFNAPLKHLAFEQTIYCVFTFENPSKTISVKANPMLSNHFDLNFTCVTPNDNLIPVMLTNKHFIRSKLTLAITEAQSFNHENMLEIASTNFDFYDCSSYSNCIDCVNSGFACKWCLLGHICTYNELTCLVNKELVPTKNNRGQLASSMCPQIAPINKTIRFLVHEKVKTQFMARIMNHNVQLGDHIQCQFKTYNWPTGNDIFVNAEYFYQNSSIICELGELILPHSYLPQKAIAVQVLINGYPLDNPYRIHVHVYRCSLLAPSCSLCLVLDPSFKCGWCLNKVEPGKGESCEIETNCQTNLLLPSNIWINQSKALMCLKPKIIDFYPKSGPIQGGTQLTINGNDFGLSIDDIEIEVSILPNLTIICNPIETWNMNQVKCNFNVNYNQIEDNQGGPVIIRVNKALVAKSRDWYYFVKPRFFKIYPEIGPQSGGTLVNLYGTNFNVGSDLQVFFNTNICEIHYFNSSTIKCITRNNFDHKNQEAKEHNGRQCILSNIYIRIDGAQLSIMDGFCFVEDPIINQIKLIGNNGRSVNYICSIPSGNIRFTVEGLRLDSIQNPRFYLNISGEEFSSGCIVRNSTLMICETPPVPEHLIYFNSTPANYAIYDFGFIMDNVTTVKSLSNGSVGDFRMFHQPIFNNFAEEDHIKELNRHYLSITGSNIDKMWPILDQIKVWLGEPKPEWSIENMEWNQTDNICNITSYSFNRLVCHLPFDADEYEEIHKKKSNEAMQCQLPVHISIGNDAHPQLLGYMNVCLVSDIHQIILHSILFLLMIIIIILMFVIFIRKTKFGVKNQKTENIEMSTMKTKYMSTYSILDEFDLMSVDLVLPTHSFSQYVLNICIPNAEEQELFISSLNDELNLPSDFKELLKDQNFLLCFIRSLHQDKNFSLNDRLRFGFFLVMALSDQMEHLTQVMLIMLKELINDYFQRKIPKLLLRRMENIVEVIVVAWLSLLLYDFTMARQKKIALTLHKLFLTLKIYSYKHPVDEITNCSFNTLTNNRVLLTNLTYETVNIIVSIFDEDQMNEQSFSGINEPGPSGINNSSSDSESEQMFKNDASLYERLVPRKKRNLIKHNVTVLSCDTINQVIRKSLDVIYRSTPFSKRRYQLKHLDLQYIKDGQEQILANIDDNNEHYMHGNIQWRRLNTLADYKIKDGAEFCLIPKEFRGFSRYSSFEPNNRSKLPRLRNKSATINQNQSSTTLTVRYWHLMNRLEQQQPTDITDDCFLLQRRVHIKRGMEKYMDELFGLIFDSEGYLDKTSDMDETKTEACHSLAKISKPIKFIFDFFDQQIECFVGNDPNRKDEREQICHYWKSNCFTLRYWVKILLNPDILLDVETDTVLFCNFSIVAKTLMESCSWRPPTFAEDSPSAKMLFAEEMPKYNAWIHSYYKKIRQMDSISEEEANKFLKNFSQRYSSQIDIQNALGNVYQYARKYQQMISNSITDPELLDRFQSLFASTSAN